MAVANVARLSKRAFGAPQAPGPLSPDTSDPSSATSTSAVPPTPKTPHSRTFSTSGGIGGELSFYLSSIPSVENVIQALGATLYAVSTTFFKPAGMPLATLRAIFYGE